MMSEQVKYYLPSNRQNKQMNKKTFLRLYDRHKFPFLLSKLTISKSLPDGAAGIF